MTHELCGGTGRLPLRQTCPDCGGEGIKLTAEEDAFELCRTCFGAGVLPIENKQALMRNIIVDMNDKVNDIKEKVDEIKAAVDLL
jgi:hypothetical protein